MVLSGAEWNVGENPWERHATVTSGSIRTSAGRTAGAHRRLRQAAGLYLAGQGVLLFDFPVSGVDLLNDAVAALLVGAAFWQVGPLLLGTPRAPLVGAGLGASAVWLTAVAVEEAVTPQTAADGATVLSGSRFFLNSSGAANVAAGIGSALTYVLFALVLLWATRRLGLGRAATSWVTSARLLAFFYVPLVAVSLATAAALALTALEPEHLTEGPQVRLVVALFVVAGLLPWAHTTLSAVRTLHVRR